MSAHLSTRLRAVSHSGIGVGGCSVDFWSLVNRAPTAQVTIGRRPGGRRPGSVAEGETFDFICYDKPSAPPPAHET